MANTYYMGTASGSSIVIFSQSLQKVPTNTPTSLPAISCVRIPAVVLINMESRACMFDLTYHSPELHRMIRVAVSVEDREPA